MFSMKLKAIKHILKAKQFHLIIQEANGYDPQTLGCGGGDLRDLLLIARELESGFNDHYAFLRNAAIDQGELRDFNKLVKELKIGD